jgi:hypothetical protein
MKFRLGDTVRVINRGSFHFDEVGRVTAIDKTASPIGWPFRISGLNSSIPLWYGPEELILAEKEDTR